MYGFLKDIYNQKVGVVQQWKKLKNQSKIPFEEEKNQYMEKENDQPKYNPNDKQQNKPI